VIFTDGPWSWTGTRVPAVTVDEPKALTVDEPKALTVDEP
jgi:hypothetical protein